MLRIRFQLLLIILAALIVFYPTLFSEFCRVDDLQMVNSFQSIQHISLKELFLPGASGGLYYRPFILASFFLDRFVFGLDSFSMHFHNLVLHTLNAILLYWIAVKVARRMSLEAPYVPLVVSLLFLLHPITTESVNWISGRTDILAATFLLISTGLLLEYLNSDKRWIMYVALAMFVCAVFSKESSLAFLPGFILLAASRHSCKTSVKTVAMFALLGVFAVGLFFLLRSMAFTSNASPIAITVKILFNTPERSLQLVLTAIGFYFKKLFIPMPLNFAIYEVNALYEFVAWPILALLLYIAWKRTLLSILFVTGILLASPALIIVFNQVAWTPFAERYLYLPAAFTTLSTTYFLRRNLEFPNYITESIVVLAVISLFAGVTFQRNLTWQSAYKIVGDTVQKSPESADMKFVYASILIGRKEYAKAREILATVKSSPGIFYDERSDMSEVDILELEGRRGDAMKQLEEIVKNSGNKSKKALAALIEIYLEEEKKSGEAAGLSYRQKIYDARKKMFKTTRDATMLYDLGLDARKLGDNSKALRYFVLATQNNPINHTANIKSREALSKLEER